MGKDDERESRDHGFPTIHWTIANDLGSRSALPCTRFANDREYPIGIFRVHERRT